MRTVSNKVQPAVNEGIAKRIKSHYPNGKKLKYQSPREWIPNAAFVNCYQAKESVGYHCDQLTYLGPRAVIGSLSLGVAREFRVRNIVARDDEKHADSKDQRADAEGQIAIHLPHNSLLVMHAEMQEEWKHRYFNPTALYIAEILVATQSSVTQLTNNLAYIQLRSSTLIPLQAIKESMSLTDTTARASIRSTHQDVNAMWRQYYDAFRGRRRIGAGTCGCAMLA